ncbi:MAG TPA: tetratricopeptide repeat protein [Gemmatimonadaceae bacterium]|nr:tetratricopeptide repeat protein [Gemmatimonadaceae bacterium]
MIGFSVSQARQQYRRVSLVLCLLLAGVTDAYGQNQVTGDAATLTAAQAATNAGNWEAASALWQKVVASNPVNAEYALRLATTLLRAKNYSAAIPAYQKALDLGADFPSNMAYNIACAYALLGDKEKAMEWLSRSFDMGFRNLELARTDSDLASLHGDARFQQIVGLPDVSRMSRDEGWRTDIALLGREVRRKGYAQGITRSLAQGQFEDSVRKLSEAVPNMSDGQIVVGMMRLLKSLGDGHTGILRPPAQADFALALPLQFYLFKEGLFIIGADPRYKELLGAQVVRFGSRSIDDVMKALDPVISRDNDLWPSQIGPYRMRSLPLLNALGVVPDIHSISLDVVDAAGKRRAVTVNADSSHPDIWNEFPADWLTYAQTLGTPLPLYLKNTASNYWFEYDPANKVVYFQFNRVLNDANESLAAFSERLYRFINEHDVSKLVIDMRWNNGGNTFLSRPLLNRIIRSDKVNQPGKLFVIIGRRTFSAAQNTATFFERNTAAIFVGEPTGSSPNFVGEETPFSLPYSKIIANVSDLYWESSWPQDHRKWIAPQIYVPPTFSAYRAGRDPAMEAILAFH